MRDGNGRAFTGAVAESPQGGEFRASVDVGGDEDYPGALGKVVDEAGRCVADGELEEKGSPIVARQVGPGAPAVEKTSLPGANDGRVLRAAANEGHDIIAPDIKMSFRGAACGGMEELLNRYKTDGAKCATHTCFGGGAYGAYYVPMVDIEFFYDEYSRHVAKHRRGGGAGPAMSLVERHRDVGPVVIDLDFRHDASSGKGRRYTRDCILRFLRKYVNVLSQWVVLPDNFRAVVMEKPQPSVDKGVLKDGVHVVIPEVVTAPRVQMLARRDFVTRYEKDAFDGLATLNSLEDIFDESVLQRNGWMMYGSGKPGGGCYEASFVWEARRGFGDLDADVVDMPPPSTEEEVARMVRLLSIRNKDAETPVQPAKQAAVAHAARVEEMASAAIRNGMFMQEGVSSKRHASTDDLEMARRLTSILDASRADCYDTWMRVGWCLHNIDDRLLPDWVAFSQLSPKFESGYCECVWGHMTHPTDGLSMGSLRRWARQDNPAMYERVVRECMSNRVQAAISGLHHDVAMVAKGMFGDRFVCSGIRCNSWYIFDGHRWRECDSGYVLRGMLSTDVYGRFMDEALACHQQVQRLSSEGQGGENSALAARHSQLSEMQRRLSEVAMKLKHTSFKDAVMRECKELFYRPRFESELDGTPNLVGFDNGVYDLDKHEFRDGMPEDMMSFSTGYDYVPYSDGSVETRDILAYFAQVQPDEAVREYLLRLLGSYLHGSIREERFHVWSGSGANSKSKCIEFVERALGDYAVKLPVALLTQRRAASNAASSEIVRLKGRRFACLQEPSCDETLNTGLLKELTGGDRIMARALYKEPVEFKPFVRLALVCNNLPNVPSTDGGTWRRMRLIVFPSKFCDNPDPNDPLQFKDDKSILDRLHDLAPHLMSLLIEKYKVYCSNGNREPEPVMRCTREYQESQDAIKMFIGHAITQSPDPSAEVPVAELHSMYRDFLREMCIAGVSTKRADFVREMERHLGSRSVGIGAAQRFTGVSRVGQTQDGPL